MEKEKYIIGQKYRLKLDDRYFWATIVCVDDNIDPPQARVVLQEHSIDSYIHGSNIRKRHTKRSEVVPCANVNLTDLRP